jgi:hypothetical protein
MSTWLLAWFTTPVQINGVERLLLLLPLCFSVSIIYKATRCERIGDIPLATFALWLTIVGGMIGVGILMWIAFLLLA